MVNVDTAKDNQPVARVYAVDDDPDMLESLGWLLSGAGVDCRCFGQGDVFLEEADFSAPACLILDVRMPKMNGFDVFKVVQERAPDMPVIFVTANGELPMAVDVLRRGAYHFIEKPYDPSDMVKLVKEAYSAAETNYAGQEDDREFLTKLNLLSPREKQVLREVTRGKHSKVIAYELGIARKTVDVHRTSIRTKLKTRSLPELIRRVLNQYPEWRSNTDDQ